jgi:hypothetical protein
LRANAVPHLAPLLLGAVYELIYLSMRAIASEITSAPFGYANLTLKHVNFEAAYELLSKET